MRKRNVLRVTAAIAVSLLLFFWCQKNWLKTPAITLGKLQKSGAPIVSEPEPTWELTIPENSPYKDLAPPEGVKPNPFLEIKRLAAEQADNDNWADKDRDIRDFLMLHEKQPYFFVLQQQAANEMLRQELFPHYMQEPEHVMVLNGIGFYTEQLLQAKSEDSKLVYMCLRALQEHWPKERIAQVALATAARVEARPILSSQDTATLIGYHQQIYARELKKMGGKFLANL